MDYQELLRKKELYSRCRSSIPEFTLFTFEQAFEIEYTHNSTAIEGNTLSLIETKVLLEDGISIGGKALREIYEAVNHRKAFHYVKECIGQGMPLDEKIIKDIHALLMENIQVGGVYRDVQVYISGARHMPPPPPLMYRQVKDFYADLSWKGKELNQVELAAWTHAEFVEIHPFTDAHVIIGTRLEKPSKINGFALLSPNFFMPERGERNHHTSTYIAGQQYESLIAIKATIPSFGDGFEGPKSL